MSKWRGLSLPALIVSAVLMLPSQQAEAAPPGAVGGYCSPGQYTQVHGYVHPFWAGNYRYTVNDGVVVNWRYYSSSVPFYWQNSFVTQGDIWSPPAWYTSVEFMCSSNSPVWIAPL